MPRKRFTDKFLAKPPLPTTGDRVFYWDETLAHFGLMVTRTGHRSWVCQVRARDKVRRVTLSAQLYSYAEARRWAIDKLRAAEDGALDGAPVETLKDVCEGYLRLEGKHLRSARLYDRTLERLVLPVLGNRPVAGIKRTEIAVLVDSIKVDNGEGMAKLAFAILRRVFSWHQSRVDGFTSTIVKGMAPKAAKVGTGSRDLEDTELRAIWAATASPGPFNAVVRMLLLTGCRRDEVGGMRWPEVDGDMWMIPSARYKTGVDHEVPLSSAATALLASIPRQGSFVFTLSGTRPIAGYSGHKARLDGKLGFDRPWTLHGLRKTARTLLSRAGVGNDVAELCLGHRRPGIERTYDRHKYRAEKRAAFEKLAALVERIVYPVDNVVALTQAPAPGAISGHVDN
jgi:integrase